MRTGTSMKVFLAMGLLVGSGGVGGAGTPDASAAAQPRLMVCETQSSDGWSAAITLEESGKATMQVRKGQETHACDLSLRNLSDNFKSRASVMSMRFERGACAPALSQVDEKNLMKNIPLLFVRGAPKAAPKGRVQWLWNSQTTPCALRVYNGPELVSKAERFKLRSWGHPEGP